MPYMGVGFGLGRNKGMLIDGFEDTVYQDAKPQGSLGGQNSSPAAATTPRKNLPIAISIPGNIITEEATSGEGSIIEELFEDLSLFQLMDMGRSETVLGQNVSYRPIKNISDIYFTYSPKKILALQGTFGETESSTSLRFNEYVVDGAAYVDSATGDLVIAVENMKDGLLVEVELITAGAIQDS